MTCSDSTLMKLWLILFGLFNPRPQCDPECTSGNTKNAEDMIGEGMEGKMPCPRGCHHTGKEKGREKEYSFNVIYHCMGGRVGH